jgi:hypothetical protein
MALEGPGVGELLAQDPRGLSGEAAECGGGLGTLGGDGVLDRPDEGGLARARIPADGYVLAKPRPPPVKDGVEDAPLVAG